MYRYSIALLLLCSLLFFATKTKFKNFSNLKQDEDIQVYFNQRHTGKQTYKDAYRQIERQGDDLEAVIIKEIKSASSSIDIAVQELNLPNIALALVEQHRSGVKVRVILDNNYSQPLSSLSQNKIRRLKQHDRAKYDEFLRLVDINYDGHLSSTEIERRDALIILRQAGIPLIDDTADGSKGSGLMHHKFMVIDNHLVITGSANWTISGIQGDFANPQTQGNANHLLKIDHAQLASLFTREFDLMWGGNSAGGVNSRFGLQKSWRSPETINWDNTSVSVQFAPTSTTQNWSDSTNGLIGRTIENAAESINLALFVFSEQKLANILEKKFQQGITIKAAFDRGFAFRYYSEVLDMLGVALKNRCQYEPDNNPWQQPIDSIGVSQLAQGDKLHHKFAIVDERTIITGSQNWSPSANTKNDETVIIIHNATVARHFQREFNRLYQLTSLGLPEYIHHKIAQTAEKCVN